MIIDIGLLLVFALVVFFAARRGFFVTLLRLGAWVVAVVAARVLGDALAQPLYNAFAAEPARRMIEQNIGAAIDGSQAAQYAGQVIADLPDALSRLAARVGGITPEYLLENLDAQQFSTENAAYVLEQSIVAPIGIAVIGFLLTIVLFIALLALCRLLVRWLEGLRKLPVLKQADGILGAVMGIIKGVVFVFIAVLVLQLIAAMSPADAVLVTMVDSSRIVAFLS